MYSPKTEVIVSRGGSEIYRTIVEPGEYVIGRSAGCAIRVEDESVGREHARITINFDHALVEDLGSGLGTFVNGKSVVAETRLWPNQKIAVGLTTVELRRMLGEPPPDVSLAPSTETVRRILPEEFLRRKKYEIGDVVAQGGMGAILDAKEATTERVVAMKVMLHCPAPEDMERFITEAKITAQLEHPGIVPVYELSVDENDNVFYTMKFVRGVTLRTVLEELASNRAETIRKFQLPQLLTVFQKMCDALAFAHSKGVIHRDLKPENVMIGDYGEVFVMDWGLAKRLADDAPSLHNANRGAALLGISAIQEARAEMRTIAGTVLGTPQYMAPEQARGEIDRLDARTDVYALGAVLYHVLALRPPVEGDDPGAVVSRAASGKIDPLVKPAVGISRLGRARRNGSALPHCPEGRIPDSLAAVVRKSMALEPASRYQSVSTLQAEIAAYQGGFATDAERASLGKQIGLFVRRHKALFATGFAAWLLIAVLAVWFVVKIAAERTRAESSLAALKRTAPTFYGQASALVESQKFEAALDKVDFAISLAPNEPDYHALKGNVLESLLRIGEAREAYAEALKCKRNFPFARENLAVCDAILAEQGSTHDLTARSLIRLHEAMRKQQRSAESIALLHLMEPSRDALYRTWLEVLQKAGFPIAHANGNELKLDDDGLFRLDLHHVPSLDTLAFLRGMPLKALDVNGTKISDLSPLAGLPLQELNIYNDTAVHDLGPLRGMKLTTLRVAYTGVRDFSVLKGMPLRVLILRGCEAFDRLDSLEGMPLIELELGGTNVTNLAPLQGIRQLARLGLDSTKVADLSALKGMPLVFLSASSAMCNDLTPLKGMPIRDLNLGATPIRDLSPLVGMPIVRLILVNCQALRDLAPLAGCTHLKALVIPRQCENFDILRQLPELRFLSYSPPSEWWKDELWTPAFSAEEFWRKNERLLK